MIIDATFWVAISFFIFLGVLIYFKIPQKIIVALNENINSIKNEVDNAEILKEESKNILSEYEKKISNAKNEVKQMIGNDYIDMHYEGKLFRYFPRFAFLPLSQKLEIRADAPFQIISKKMLKEVRHILFFEHENY